MIMTIAARMPLVYRLVDKIIEATEPVASPERSLHPSSIRSVEWLLRNYWDGGYHFHDAHPHVGAVSGVYFEEKSEAAEVTRAAFNEVFGPDREEGEIKSLIFAVLSMREVREALKGFNTSMAQEVEVLKGQCPALFQRLTPEEFIGRLLEPLNGLQADILPRDNDIKLVEAFLRVWNEEAKQRKRRL